MTEEYWDKTEDPVLYNWRVLGQELKTELFVTEEYWDKSEAEWSKKSEIRKAEFLAEDDAYKVKFSLTLGLKEKTFRRAQWILNRGDFSFCVCGSRRRVKGRKRERKRRKKKLTDM